MSLNFQELHKSITTKVIIILDAWTRNVTYWCQISLYFRYTKHDLKKRENPAFLSPNKTTVFSPTKLNPEKK